MGRRERREGRERGREEPAKIMLAASVSRKDKETFFQNQCSSANTLVVAFKTHFGGA